MRLVAKEAAFHCRAGEEGLQCNGRRPHDGGGDGWRTVMTTAATLPAILSISPWSSALCRRRNRGRRKRERLLPAVLSTGPGRGPAPPWPRPVSQGYCCS